VDAQVFPALLRRALFGQQEGAYHRGGGPSDFTSGGLALRQAAGPSNQGGAAGPQSMQRSVSAGSEAFAPGRPGANAAAEPTQQAVPFQGSFQGASRAGEAALATEFSGLGAHVAMVALSVFVAYGWLLGLKVLESAWAFLGRHSVLSGVRLFKMSMLVALMMIRTVRPRLRTPMQPEW
jgi:hypothetical protein